MNFKNEIRIFSGSSNPKLASDVCRYLDVELGEAEVERFPDSEKIIRVEDDVRGRDCFVIQSTCNPTDEHIMELLIFIDCLRRASAKRITAVIRILVMPVRTVRMKVVSPLRPSGGQSDYYGGSQSCVGCGPACQSIAGLFRYPGGSSFGELVLRRHFEEKKIDKLTVASPDVGNIKTAARYADYLGGELAIIHKKRVSGSEVEAAELIGSVEGRNILMCDDIIATAGTVCSAARLVKERGAKSVSVSATHGVFAGQAAETSTDAPIDEIVVTDTIPLNGVAKKLNNVKVLSSAAMLGEAIRRIHRNESVSIMFEGEGI